MTDRDLPREAPDPRRRATAGVPRRRGLLGLTAVGLTLAGALLWVGLSPGTPPMVLTGYGRGAASPPVAARMRATASAHLVPPVNGSFTISGAVSGLYPGASVPLGLTVTNPQRFAILVTSVTATVTAPAGTCGAANVAVSPFAGNLFVAAGRTAGVTVRVTMSHSAPSSCQGVQFTFTYGGLARQWSR